MLRLICEHNYGRMCNNVTGNAGLTEDNETYIKNIFFKIMQF